MTAVLFCFGLIIGSFLNVLILRYDPDQNADRRGLYANIRRLFKTAGGRSRCLHCGKQLRWYELIPIVSWVILLGRCRSCKKRISVQYPFVEAGSALAFAFVPQFVHVFLFQVGAIETPLLLFGASAVWLLSILILLCIFFIDIRHYIIPNYLNLSIFGLGIIWTIAGSLLSFSDSLSRGSLLGNFGDLFVPNFFGSGDYSFALSHVFGALIAGMFFLAIVLVTRGRGMGMGDVKLIAALGMLFGFPDILLIITLSFVLGALYAVPLLVAKKTKLSHMVPFGPFIVLASLVVFFAGAMVMKGYFDIIEGLSL